MSCIKLPNIPKPELPSPIVLTPPSASGDVGINAELCCKLLQFDIPLPPLPIGPLVLNPTVLEAMKTYIDQANAWINSLPLDCPLE